MDAPAERADNADHDRDSDEPGGYFFDPERDLRILCEELYEGSWELFLHDLENRLEMKPPIYKITENIRADIEVIKQIMEKEGSTARKD